MHNAGMPAITIRNVPQPTRDVLAARAEQAGQSLQEYLLGELVQMAAAPTVEEWLELAAEHREARPAGDPTAEVTAEQIVELVRAGRAER